MKNIQESNSLDIYDKPHRILNVLYLIWGLIKKEKKQLLQFDIDGFTLFHSSIEDNSIVNDLFTGPNNNEMQTLSCLIITTSATKIDVKLNCVSS